MECDLCGRINGHLEGCPNYEPPKVRHYCSSCGQGIYNGEEYVLNSDGEYRHYECFYGMRDMLEWLGCEIKTFEDDYYD